MLLVALKHMTTKSKDPENNDPSNGLLAV